MINTGKNSNTGEGKEKSNFPYKKCLKTNGEVVKAWVFQAESPRCDSGGSAFFSFTLFFPLKKKKKNCLQLIY